MCTVARSALLKVVKGFVDQQRGREKGRGMNLTLCTASEAATGAELTSFPKKKIPLCRPNYWRPLM